MDEKYLLEFHSEWVVTIGKGLRIDKMMIPLFFSLGVITLVVGLYLQKNFIYIPHGTIQPEISREEFHSLLE